jgi:tetratricopeptide (TPR) repeat protein
MKKTFLINIMIFCFFCFLFAEEKQIDPKARDAYEKGVNANSEGELNVAVKYLKKAIEIYPDYEDAIFKLGYVLEKQEEYEEALKYYEKVIELNPKAWDAWYSIGIVYAKMEQYKKALPYMKKAYELKPDNPDVMDSYARLYRYLGNHKKADKIIEEYHKKYDKR